MSSLYFVKQTNLERVLKAIPDLLEEKSLESITHSNTSLLLIIRFRVQTHHSHHAKGGQCSSLGERTDMMITDGVFLPGP